VPNAAGVAITIGGTRVPREEGRMSRAVEPSPGHVLHIEAIYDDAEATIILDGELDMAGLARFGVSSAQS
jgi:hypothetical protein